MVQIVPSGNAELSPLPSRRARQLLGSQRLSELCGRTSEAVRKWDRPRSKGGTGGLIPSEFLARVLAEAEARDLPLSARDLIAEPLP